MVKGPFEDEMDMERRLVFHQIRAVEAGRMSLKDATAIPQGAELIDGKVVIPTPLIADIALPITKAATFLVLAASLWAVAAFAYRTEVGGWPIAFLLLASAVCLGFGFLIQRYRDIRRLPVIAIAQIGVAALSVIPVLIATGLEIASWIGFASAAYAVADGFANLKAARRVAATGTPSVP